MPKQMQTRREQISFRPVAFIEQTVLPTLVEAWGEERTRVISRALQIAYDLRQIENSLKESNGPKGRPLALRLSRIEEEVILPELCSRWKVDDYGQAINIALLCAWKHWKT